MMTNVPTEMLRTLVAVVDHKSFTKAATSIGVTQPAVSAQIKRLQAILHVDLFDKDAAGVVLTSGGDAVVTYARRMLSINDQIVKMASPEANDTPIKLGATGDDFSPNLADALVKFRRRWPGRKFTTTHAPSAELLLQLRAGELDVVMSFTSGKPERDARYHWTEELAWVRGRTLAEPIADIVPLVVRHDDSINQAIAVAALEKIGRGHDIAFRAPTILALMSAVRNGFGITPFPGRRIASTDLVVVQDQSLPKLPDVVCSICVREAAESEMFDDLARAVAEMFKPAAEFAAAGKVQELAQARA